MRWGSPRLTRTRPHLPITLALGVGGAARARAIARIEMWRRVGRAPRGRQGEVGSGHSCGRRSIRERLGSCLSQLSHPTRGQAHMQERASLGLSLLAEQASRWPRERGVSPLPSSGSKIAAGAFIALEVGHTSLSSGLGAIAPCGRVLSCLAQHKATRRRRASHALLQSLVGCRSCVGGERAREHQLLAQCTWPERLVSVTSQRRPGP